MVGCDTCARQATATAEADFRAAVAERRGRIVGPYVDNATPVACICEAGHACAPRPNNVLRGHGICLRCRHAAGWSVFYVVVNPTLSRVKLGVTNRHGRHRLGNHRRAGYTDVVRLLLDLPDADALERHILATMRDARIPPVQGREYFHIDALALVLDVVDGWTAA